MISPRTAVILPTRAQPGWDRFVPDLIGQSQPASEIIIVIDRATTPDEEAHLRQYWPMLRFIFNRDNIGITPSLNRAIHATDADLIFRADDDDQSYSRRFAQQLACFARTGADFVCSWAEGVNGDSDSKINGGRPYLITSPTDGKAIRAALLRRNVLVHSTLAFRRETVLRIGGYDETFVNAQDYALYLAAIRADCQFAMVPEPLVRRHYHTNNITTARRTHQIMYSCAARIVHHAATGDRASFFKSLLSYALLLAIPHHARTIRRKLFSLIGRGT